MGRSRGSSARGPRRLWATVGSTAATKVLVMGVSGLLGIITSRLILTNFGIEAYANYGLLATLPQLLPFADLGIAAVVINAVAGSSDPRRDEMVRRTITSALRILIVSGSTIALVSGVLYVTGLWPVILGKGLLDDGGAFAAFLCLLVFGLVLPMGIGQRILVGLDKTSVQVGTQALSAPLILATVGLVAALALPAAAYLPVATYIASGAVSALCLAIAAHSLKGQFGRAVRDIPRLRRAPGVPVFNLAWPMLIQMVALPLAMQTDRLLLSHLATVTALAQYNLAMQLFSIVIQTIAAAGVALWPYFARARSQAQVASPWAPLIWFMIGGTLVACTLGLLSGFLADIISDGRIVLDPLLVVCFVVFVALQSVKYPLGMYMTDERGLKFQVVPTLLMIPIGLGSSWLLILAIGPAGAIAGSAIAVALCQVIPMTWYVRRDLARRRAEQADAGTADTAPTDPEASDS